MKNCAASIARTAACWLAALALFLVPLDMAWSQNPQDRGIGGTGMLPGDLDGDRGIGGTGVMGTIRGFGSIVVNNLHVTYASDVPVLIDGEPRTVSDLKIGQVVRVIAEQRNGVLATGRIDVASEVVGPIEATGGKTLRVLGQTVSIEKLSGTERWRRGERIAVFGLRRPDGTIVASLLERRVGGTDRVAGRLRKQQDGSFMIGQLRLTGADPALAGSRVVVEGASSEGILKVTRTVRERDLLGPNLRRYSIEAYVERTRNGLRFASGLDVAQGVISVLPAGSYAPAVVTVTADKTGRLAVERISLEGPPARPNEVGQGLAPSSSSSKQPDVHGRGGMAPDLRSSPPQRTRDGVGSGTARGRNDDNGSPGGNTGNSSNRSGESSGGKGSGGGGGNQGGGRGSGDQGDSRAGGDGNASSGRDGGSGSSSAGGGAGSDRGGGQGGGNGSDRGGGRGGGGGSDAGGGSQGGGGGSGGGGRR